MIDLAKCNEQADLIDDAGIAVKKIASYYDEAYYYMKKNISADSSAFLSKMENDEKKLEYIKTNLSNIAYKIRNKAREIYDEELEKQRRDAKNGENVEVLGCN